MVNDVDLMGLMGLFLNIRDILSKKGYENIVI